MKRNDNMTADAIVERLPSKPLLSAREVADAIGAASTKPVIEAIEAGRLSAAAWIALGLIRIWEGMQS